MRRSSMEVGSNIMQRAEMNPFPNRDAFSPGRPVPVPIMGPVRRNPGSSHSVRFEIWRADPFPLIQEDSRQNSRSALQRAMDARDKLCQAKKANAESLRNELQNYKVERMARLAEEAETNIMKTRSRMTTWELERQERRDAAERARREIQAKRRAEDFLHHGQKMALIYSNQKAELRRLKVLKERMMKTNNSTVLPNSSSRFSAFKGPVQPDGTITPAAPNTADARVPAGPQPSKRVPNFYERHMLQQNNVRHAASNFPVQRPFYNSRRQNSPDHLPVGKTAQQEGIRIRMELHALEKSMKQRNNY